MDIIPHLVGEGGLKSKETKKKMSEARIGKPSWNKGISRTKEEKEKISLKLKEKFKNKENHAMFGKIRQDISKMNELRVGDKNPNFGKKAWNSGISFEKKSMKFLAINKLNNEKFELSGIKEIEKFCRNNNISYSSFLKYRKCKNFELVKEGD